MSDNDELKLDAPPAGRRVKTLSTGSSVDSEGSRRARLNMPMMYQMYESQYEDLRGTVYGPDSPDFHPVQASETLRKALHGIDTSDQTIIQTILYHNNFQRQKILSAYEDLYSRNLVDDLEEETGGYFLEMCQVLFKPAHKYDTISLYKALSNRHGDRSVAIEIACTRSAKQLRVIKDTYHQDYRKALDKDVGLKVEGVVGRMLTLLLCTSREEGLGKRVDEDLVEKQAQTLSAMSIEDLARNLQLFEEIFIGNSWKHVGAVLDRVDDLRRDVHDMENAIRRNKIIHSEVRLILITILRVSRNLQLYFAEKLRAAMSGDRPDHNTIIRICVTRSEIDLYDIAEEYKRKYQKPLEMDISQTCSGDYMRLACALINGSANNNNLYSITPDI